ncbi:MAG TPA: hypothetical protein V6D22_24585 [Candidatus Obscuribacterales bacterium]
MQFLFLRNSRLLYAALVLSSFAIGNSPANAAFQSPIPSIIDFRFPQRGYTVTHPGVITAYVENQLLRDNPAIAEKAVSRLNENARAALSLLPEQYRAELRQIPFYVLYGPKSRGGGHANGLEYFGFGAPHYSAGVDERWSNCIVVYCAENYANLSDLWALKAVMHEYGHAHQLLHWKERQPDIYQAWQNAVKSGLYCNVKGSDGSTIPRAYALKNQLEYFAELTCMYEGTCDYFPFNRNELKAYDPQGYRMIQLMWSSQPPQS